MKGYSKYSGTIFYLSLAAVFFAFWGWLFFDIWLASTQWLLVAIYLIALAFFLRGERR